MRPHPVGAPVRRALRGRPGAWLAVLAVLACLWPFAPVQKLSVYDQPFYIGIAEDIVTHATFTDGFMFASPGPDGRRPPGMRFAPLYPAFLALALEVEGEPARAARLVRAVQFAMLAVSYALIWDIGAAFGVAWTSLLLALLTAPLLLASVDYLMTETLTLLLTTALTAALVRRARGGGLAWAAAAGVALGLAILTRPAFLYLGVALVAAMAWRARRAAILVGLVASLVVSPWIVRNAVVLGRPQLTFGYAGHTLAQRISFDAMNGREYALSFVCWLPDGNGLGRMLAGHDACARFGWDERPDTFYAIGMRVLVPQTLRAAGGPAHHLRWLFTHEIMRDPLWHAATTIPLALRGLWVDHYWGLILGPVCIATLFVRRDPAFLALSLPAFFMLVFNAAFAVNQVRYNLMLIVPLSVAGALLAHSWAARRLRRG